jgi:hypothetical protein
VTLLRFLLLVRGASTGVVELVACEVAVGAVGRFGGVARDSISGDMDLTIPFHSSSV